jgi:hypothetical protein
MAEGPGDAAMDSVSDHAITDDAWPGCSATNGNQAVAGTCMICLADLDPGEPTSLWPGCDHTSHVGCVVRFLRSRFPTRPRELLPHANIIIGTDITCPYRGSVIPHTLGLGIVACNERWTCVERLAKLAEDVGSEGLQVLEAEDAEVGRHAGDTQELVWHGRQLPSFHEAMAMLAGVNDMDDTDGLDVDEDDSMITPGANAGALIEEPGYANWFFANDYQYNVRDNVLDPPAARLSNYALNIANAGRLARHGGLRPTRSEQAERTLSEQIWPSRDPDFRPGRVRRRSSCPPPC